MDLKTTWHGYSLSPEDGGGDIHAFVPKAIILSFYHEKINNVNS